MNQKDGGGGAVLTTVCVCPDSAVTLQHTWVKN